MGAIEIQFPGEAGFFIGKPMIYVIKATAGDPNVVGSEGIYQFGPNKVTLDGVEYYDSAFSNVSSSSHFYLGIDSAKALVTQKGITFLETEISITPAIVSLKYPLISGKSWDDKTKLVAKNIEIPNLAKLPELIIDNVNVQTTVTSETLIIPSGTFDCLLVKTTFNGLLKISGLSLPATLIQRTWMSEDNVPIKRKFEFITMNMTLYDMELSEPNPDPYDLNWDGVANILDLMIITKYYGTQMKSTRIPNPDIDGNGVVDMKDLNLAISHFGEIYKKK